MKKTVVVSVVAVLLLSQTHLCVSEKTQMRKVSTKKYLVVGAKIGKGCVKIVSALGLASLCWKNTIKTGRVIRS